MSQSIVYSDNKGEKCIKIVSIYCELLFLRFNEIIARIAQQNKTENETKKWSDRLKVVQMLLLLPCSCRNNNSWTMASGNCHNYFILPLMMSLFDTSHMKISGWGIISRKCKRGSCLFCITIQLILHLYNQKG